MRCSMFVRNRKVTKTTEYVIVRREHLDAAFFIHLSVPVAARSKALVRGRSLAGTVGSITAGGMDVCLL
jgi:hypothetical protein